MVERGGGQAEGSVGREQGERLDVDGVVRRVDECGPRLVLLLNRGYLRCLWLAAGWVEEGVRLEATDNAADDFGLGRRIVTPEDDAREEPRGKRFEDFGVEGVRVGDLQEERVDAAEGGYMVFGHRDYAGLRGDRRWGWQDGDVGWECSRDRPKTGTSWNLLRRWGRSERRRRRWWWWYGGVIVVRKHACRCCCTAHAVLRWRGMMLLLLLLWLEE